LTWYLNYSRQYPNCSWDILLSLYIIVASVLFTILSEHLDHIWRLHHYPHLITECVDSICRLKTMLTLIICQLASNASWVTGLIKLRVILYSMWLKALDWCSNIWLHQRQCSPAASWRVQYSDFQATNSCFSHIF